MSRPYSHIRQQLKQKQVNTSTETRLTDEIAGTHEHIPHAGIYLLHTGTGNMPA